MKIGCVGSEWMKNWSLEARFLLDVTAYFIFNAVESMVLFMWDLHTTFTVSKIDNKKQIKFSSSPLPPKKTRQFTGHIIEPLVVDYGIAVS